MAKPADLSRPPLRILAVDVGGGTQDVLVYDSSRPVENCVRLVLPAQTQVVAERIRWETRAGRPICLTGYLMGGGASGDAVEEHLAAGLAVFATPAAAMTLDNNLDKVRSLGIQVVDNAPPGVARIHLTDLDMHALRAALVSFAIEPPDLLAVAVQDHGYLPGVGGRDFRSEYLRSLIEGDGNALNMLFETPPEPMIRMHALQQQYPHALVMDTGAAAVLGSLGDPLVAAAARADGAILVNVGNLHTFAVAFRGERIYGLFEHHTGGVTAEWLGRLVEQLRAGTLTHADVKAQRGHGAAFRSDYAGAGRFEFIAVTGPNRAVAAPLGYHAAVPHGDMMLTGAYGLVEATLRRLDRLDQRPPVTTLMPPR